jgi:hypothetical protein
VAARLVVMVAEISSPSSCARWTSTYPRADRAANADLSGKQPLKGTY